MLKLRHFRLIETLVATRNMRLAGERLGVSAAAVSKGCIEIEDLLGMRLFDRTKEGLMPSAACIRLLESGRRIEAELRVLSEELPALDGTLQGTVRIGLQAPILQRTVAQAICRIKAEHPFLSIYFEYGMRDRLLADLKMHRLDLVIIDLLEIGNHAWVSSVPLARDRVVVLSNIGHRPSAEEAMDWARLSQRCWIVPGVGLAMRPIFERMLAASGLRMPPNRIEINSGVEFDTLLQHSQGLGWAPVSALRDDTAVPPRFYRETTLLPEPEIVMGLVWSGNAGLTSGMRAAANMLAAICGSAPPFPG